MKAEYFFSFMIMCAGIALGAMTNTNKVAVPPPSSTLDAENPALMHSKFKQVESGAPLMFDMDAIAALKAPGNLAEINCHGQTLLTVSSNWFVYASGHLLGYFEGTNWIAAPPSPAPPQPTFVDGVRIGAIVGRRNPDVMQLDALVQMCGVVWSAEQQRKGAQP